METRAFKIGAYVKAVPGLMWSSYEGEIVAIPDISFSIDIKLWKCDPNNNNGGIVQKVGDIINFIPAHLIFVRPAMNGLERVLAELPE